MNKLALLTVFAFVGFQAVSGRAAAPEKSALDSITDDAKKTIDELAKSLGIADLNSQNVVEKISVQAKAFAKDIDTAVDKLKKDIDAKKPELDKVIKEVEAQLKKTSLDFQKLVGPDATNKGKEIKEKLEKGFQEAVGSVQKLVKAVEPETTKLKTDIEKTGKALLDQVVTLSKKIETEIKKN